MFQSQTALPPLRVHVTSQECWRQARTSLERFQDQSPWNHGPKLKNSTSWTLHHSATHGWSLRPKTGSLHIWEHKKEVKWNELFWLNVQLVLFSEERIYSFCWILRDVSALKRLMSKKKKEEQKRLKSSDREYLPLVSQTRVTLINPEVKISRNPPSLQGISDLSHLLSRKREE